MAKNYMEQKAEILRMAKEGVAYSKIASLLNQAGYRNYRGKEVTVGDISGRCIDWGYRRSTPHKRRRNTNTGTTAKIVAQPKKSTGGSSLLQDVEELITSNLNPVLKERILKTLF